VTNRNGSTGSADFKRRNEGLTLIEALITLLVLTLGLLGVAGMMAHSLKNNHSSYLRSQATVLAYDIADRMRANRAAVETKAYALALGKDPLSSGIAQQDLLDWQAALARFLPSGTGAVACGADGAPPFVCRITVQWDDSRGAADPAQVIVSSEI